MQVYGKYIKKYRVPAFGAMLCVTLEAGCDLLGPTLMAKIINEGIIAHSMAEVTKWGGMMLLITICGAFFAITRSILASTVSQRIGADLRYEVFKKILNFSEASADKIATGSLITRMTNDINQLTQFINGMMRIFIKAPLVCLGSIILATLLNPQLSIIIYGFVALVATVIAISLKLSYPLYAKVQQAIDRVNSVVQEYLLGIRLVKALGTYNEETERFEQANKNLEQRSLASQMIFMVSGPLIMLLFGTATTGVLYWGSSLFAKNLANPGEISAFIIYMTQMLIAIMMITSIFNVFVRTKTSSERILEVLNSEEDFSNSGIEQKLQGSIEFSRVSFAYPNGSGLLALSDVSFKINAGENLAIIGPTGSGKSTLAWLLLRFYQANQGKILLDGLEINSLAVHNLRSQIAIVPQKSLLFSGTIEENLLWGNMQADTIQRQRALELARADFVQEFPAAEQTVLGSRGVNLSGGQRQRLSLARALLKQAKILILDDATSALDGVTEAKVLKNLQTVASNHTVIIITQRCSTAMAAGRILVLDEGKQVGFGTHSELMQQCPTYQEIYKTQIESNKVS